MKTLRNRIRRMEAHSIVAPVVFGWIILREGEILGFAPTHTDSPSQVAALRTWLQAPEPGFVFLIARQEEEGDVDAPAFVPIEATHRTARALAAPYGRDGAALHLAGEPLPATPEVACARTRS